MDLVLATRNAHKTREVQRILGAGFTVRDLTDHPEIPEVIETGTTFEENAILKAVAGSGKLSGLVISDDSGLEVDALGGAPGICSARYAGTRATDKENVAKLLRELEHINEAGSLRSARFRCVIAMAQQGELLGTFHGTVEGTIAESPRGTGGFGYDPVFRSNGFEDTFAQLSPTEKDRLSHRSRALAKLRDFLNTPRR